MKDREQSEWIHIFIKKINHIHYVKFRDELKYPW